MEKLEKIAKIIKEANEEKVLVKEVEAFGYQFTYKQEIIGSVSKFWFGKHEVNEYLAPLSNESKNDNRPGTLKESTQYIVVHDTGSSAESADALSHAKYVFNGGGGTSWHYSSGSDGIYHQIPDDEVAYHAGDGLAVPFSLTKTNVKGENVNPKVTIKDGFYYIDGKKSDILAPKVTFIYSNDGVLKFASDGIIQGRKAPEGSKENEEYKHPSVEKINDGGVRIDLKEDGYYYMGPTYYSPSYGYIANRGGNLHSVGIETMVNKGSDLYLTWQKTAKLVANLLKDFNLGLDRVKQHHFFSGKDCPQTLRHASLWEKFMEMVKVEYEILLLSDGVEISFSSESDLVDTTGRVKKVPDEKTEIKYEVNISDGKNNIKLNLVTEIGG